MPSLGVIPANIRINFISPETRMIVLRDPENCIRLHKTLECDGWTERIALAVTVNIHEVPCLRPCSSCRESQELQEYFLQEQHFFCVLKTTE